LRGRSPSRQGRHFTGSHSRARPTTSQVLSGLLADPGWGGAQLARALA
jgi:hypothetical protein